MQGMLLEKPGTGKSSWLRLVELEMPALDEDELLIDIQACGVCRTDLHIVEGDLELPRLPIIPGHQVVGTVRARGSAVQDVAPGDRVGIPWLYSTCRTCIYCQSERENLCDTARFTGLHVPGGFATQIIGKAGFVYPLPEGLPSHQAAPLLCAGVIGYRALRLAEVPRGGNIGFYGFGASAHLTIQIACDWGCRPFVFSRSPDHRRLAMELGAVWTGEARQTPPEMLDSAVIFAPAGWLVPEALRVLKKGGTVALAGIHATPIPELPYALIYGERRVCSVANSTRRDVHELLELAVRIPLRTQVEVFPLEAANRALQGIKTSRIRGAAVLQIN